MATSEYHYDREDRHGYDDYPPSNLALPSPDPRAYGGHYASPSSPRYTPDLSAHTPTPTAQTPNLSEFGGSHFDYGGESGSKGFKPDLGSYDAPIYEGVEPPPIYVCRPRPLPSSSPYTDTEVVPPHPPSEPNLLPPSQRLDRQLRTAPNLRPAPGRRTSPSILQQDRCPDITSAPVTETPTGPLCPDGVPAPA